MHSRTHSAVANAFGTCLVATDASGDGGRILGRIRRQRISDKRGGEEEKKKKRGRRALGGRKERREKSRREKIKGEGELLLRPWKEERGQRDAPPLLLVVTCANSKPPSKAPLKPFSFYSFTSVYATGMPPRRVYQRRRADGRDGGEREEERHAAPNPLSPLPDAATRILEGMARLLERHTRGVQEDLLRKVFIADVRSRLKREFMSLRQGDLSVAEFVKKFDRGCHFVPLIANDATEKLRHFLDGLRPTIRRDVLLADPTEYQDAVTRAFRVEQSLKDIEWEVQRKRPPPQQQQQQNKKLYTGPQKGQG
ncbi:hypothetical protein ZIOFF_009658 [Zingiber officinale]|uniref:Retrotransposon gag domain-containing protein n=1 Tax=Zingiber officinale TaxID=94328 RepID=A0A8J5HUB4_ZINOF|nr:hypothetical protein ZIOFF_009658 [Zingiber officinale]